jgi:hypothetical protein
MVDTQDKPTHNDGGRAKYVTLTLLVLWVAAVFGYTLFKFGTR